MVGLLDTLVNAVIISALYAVVAIGFTLIFGVGGVLNLAHGANITVGAFSAFILIRILEVPLVPGIVGGVLVAGAFSGLLYLGMIRYVEDEPIMVMILTLVTAVAVEQIFLNGISGETRFIPSLVPGNVTLPGGVTEQANLLVVFVLSWVVIGALFAFVNYTRTGKALLATSMSRKGAALVGIESGRINLATWVIAGVLAGIAGVFLASHTGVSWTMGRGPLVLSFSIVVLGGVGSIRGSVVGAYLIGTLEVFISSYSHEFFDGSVEGLVPLVVLLVVLIVKPEGLFGRELAHD